MFVRFENHYEIVYKPFVILADFESRLEKVNVQKGDKTELIQRHKPSGYCLRLISRLKSFESCRKSYTAKTNDSDVSFHFLKSVVDLVKKIGNNYAVDEPMEMTEEQELEFENAMTCWICEKRFDNDDVENNKVCDHCHYTGKYRGPAHNLCNLKLRKDKTVVVGFHNGTNYDFYLFVKDLGRIDGQIRVIAKNSEKYISVEKSVCVGEYEVLDKDGNPMLDKDGNPKIKKDVWNIRFGDTCGIVRDKLENLVKNLPRDKFKILRKEFPEDEKFNLGLQKGVFPYEWFDSVEKLNETRLPPIEKFYSRGK